MFLNALLGQSKACGLSQTSVVNLGVVNCFHITQKMIKIFHRCRRPLYCRETGAVLFSLRKSTFELQDLKEKKTEAAGNGI